VPRQIDSYTLFKSREGRGETRNHKEQKETQDAGVQVGVGERVRLER
jgi:hypothetical protein